MAIININDRKIERLRIAIYGQSGAGKTHCGATFPRPRILADPREGGWRTVQFMDRDKWFEKDFVPEVRTIEKSGDLHKELNEIAVQVQNKPGEIQTVVIDNLTAYADFVMAAIERDVKAEPTSSGKFNKFEVYTRLATHIRSLMLRAHDIPINVVWCLLEKEPADDIKRGGIMLAGQWGNKLPSTCDIWAYALKKTVGSGEEFELRTRTYGQFPARNRFGALLPDPIEPTYRAIATALGMISPPVAPPRAANPPVAARRPTAR